ncbi:MAG: hypothetical protein AAF933_04705 [Pseudomonadota bacterium]
MKEVVYGLLDLLMAGAVYVAVVWLFLTLASLGMMGAAIIRRPESRRVPVAVLVLALGYTLTHVALFLCTIAGDAFAIFTGSYVLVCGLALPLLGLAPLVLLLRRSGSLGWRGAGGYSLWLGCVAFAHLFVVAVLSASV